VSNIVWRLNVNCIVLGIVGVLNMLNNDGCPELRQLCNLAASRNAAVLEDVPEVVHMLEGRIVRRWWKPHGVPEALRRLDAAHAAIVSDSNG
jgi:hypothetical protein